MKLDLKKLQFQVKGKFSIFSILILLLLSVFACNRETPNEPIDDGKPPAAPSGLNVFRSFDGEIGFEWNKNLEPDISYYKIYRSTDSLSFFEKIDSTKNLYYFDIHLSYDSTYYYKITAVDNYSLESNFSNIISAEPKNIYRPYRPQSVTSNARNWSGKLSVHLNWKPPIDTDIKKYNIFRSNSENVPTDSSHFIGNSTGTLFIDSTNLSVLKEYYYCIIAEDKGGLKSDPSEITNDIILDTPKIVFPKNNEELNYFFDFQIKTCSKPANYKLVIQTNELFGVIKEIDFSSDKINQVINIPLKNIVFDSYRKYFWRVFSYTNSDTDPNSISEFGAFTIIPDN